MSEVYKVIPSELYNRFKEFLTIKTTDQAVEKDNAISPLEKKLTDKNPIPHPQTKIVNTSWITFEEYFDL